MKIVSYYMKKFNEDLLFDFINFTNSLDREGTIINIYLNSQGGSTDIKNAIVDITNRFKHIIYVISAESAAFDFIFECEGKKVITDESRAMYHLGEISIPYRDGMLMSEVTSVAKYRSEVEFAKLCKVIETLGFTDDEIQKIHDGKELWFDSRRLKSFFD